ncbi:MAG: hypothetical protein ACREP7_07725, partial [Lysobacter sp.]
NGMNKIASAQGVDKIYKGGQLAESIDDYLPHFKELTNSGEPFLANINKHWVIVDKFNAPSRTVMIRDPWNSNIPSNEFRAFEFGRTVEMDESAFIQAWKNTDGTVVW